MYECTVDCCCSVVNVSHNRLEDTKIHDVFAAMGKLVREKCVIYNCSYMCLLGSANSIRE